MGEHTNNGQQEIPYKYFISNLAQGLALKVLLEVS